MTTDRLSAHLRAWLGAWPPSRRIEVVGSAARQQPGWDGKVRPFLGVGSPDGAVLSVLPTVIDAVRALGDDLDAPDYGETLAAALGRPGWAFGRGVFRWAERVPDLPQPGVWLPTSDARIPRWLRPFNGDVLVVLDRDGYVAGVGRKQHDPCGHELAVGTEPRARGRGLGRQLVAQAARRVMSDGAVATYLHDPSNIPSARVADAAGFPDRGWSVYGLWPPASGSA